MGKPDNSYSLCITYFANILVASVFERKSRIANTGTSGSRLKSSFLLRCNGSYKGCLPIFLRLILTKRKNLRYEK